MKTSSQLRTQLHTALVDAFPTLDDLDQLVQEALHVNRARITTSSGLDAIVDALLTHCEGRESVGQLLCVAYNRNPSNTLLSRLVAQASKWPELSGAGFVFIEGTAYVCARRHVELAYLNALIEKYNYWAEKYTPLAGIAEVRTAATDGPRLDLPMHFMPTGFEKLEEHGFSPQREVKRVPVADLRQAIDEHKRLVLLGEPGAGKTTTLWRLTYDLAMAALADDAAPLPLLAPLGGYTGPEPALAFVQGHFGDLGPHLPAYLQAGRVVLLLDALNEMPQWGRRERVDRIRALLDRFKKMSALVTCRALDYVSGDAEPLALQKLEVKPLDPERQRSYLHRYLGAEEGETLFWQLMGDDLRELWQVWADAGGTWVQFWTAEKMPEKIYRRITSRQDKLWRELRSGNLPPLLALGVNPFMLVMLAQVYAAGKGIIPQNRGKLFAAFVDTLLAREEEKRHDDKESWPGIQPLRNALARLAYAMHLAGERGTAVERAWALGELGDGCEPEQVLYVAAGATLLELTDGQVRFVHQLIQEYFAAVAWGTEWNAGKPLTNHWPGGWLHTTGWEETAVLLAGILPVEGPFGIASFVDDLLAVNPPLAARCLAESGQEPADEQCIERVQNYLVAIATGTVHSAKERVAAGGALNHVGDSRSGVGLTADGLPDIVWCQVPSGEFIMGSTKQTDEMAQDREAPQHRLALKAFAMARYPITNIQFEAFVNDGGYTEHWRHCWTDAGWRWRTQENSIGSWKYGRAYDQANHPVVAVSWYEAVAFCRWLSEKLGRQVTLPSEAQWEKAARGRDGQRYPWGQDPDPNWANYRDTGIETTSAVGSFPGGVSPYGCEEMAGNVWEWTSSKWGKDWVKPEFVYPYDPEDGRENPQGNAHRVLRGDAFNGSVDHVRCAYRLRNPPDDRSNDFGFRVVVVVSPFTSGL